MPADVDRLARVAAGLVRSDQRVVLGICGEPGAGKTTLAQGLVGAVNEALDGIHGPGFAAHLPMDGFHLADAQLERLGLLGRKGAPESFDVDGYVALLERVRAVSDRPVYAPGFERTLEQPIAAALVIPATTRLVVTEGNYLLLRHPEWAPVSRLLDEVWWVQTPDNVRMERLTARHARFGKTLDTARAWVRDVDEPNALLVRAGRAGADRIVRSSSRGWELDPHC